VKAFAALPLGYLTMYLGGRLPLHQVGRRNDISYGVYIYAFPVQQLLATYAWYRWGFAVYVALTVVAAGALAVASWLLVERPIMRRARAITVIHLPRSDSAIGPPDERAVVLEVPTARS
jgi:peptidoglycan/LPS O-acetylase OafA/YrhL